MRVQAWVANLWQTIDAHDGAEFDYRSHHCGMFAARCVDAVTGSTWAQEMPVGKRAAVEFLRCEGGIEAAVTKRLGEPIAGHAARRGDVCAVDVEDGIGLGVCVGDTIAVAAETGVTFYPLARAHKHWRVD